MPYPPPLRVNMENFAIPPAALWRSRPVLGAACLQKRKNIADFVTKRGEASGARTAFVPDRRTVADRNGPAAALDEPQPRSLASSRAEPASIRRSGVGTYGRALALPRVAALKSRPTSKWKPR